MTRPLREAHAHLPQLGRAMSFVHLDDCADADNALARIVARAQQEGSTDDWLIATGARPAAWTDPRWPTLAELDNACPTRPCAVWCFDYHAILANTPALRGAGILANTPDPPGGIIERDDQNEPTGLLLEQAALDLWNAVPEPPAAERRAHLVDALDHLASLGYVEAHDLRSPSWLGPLLAQLHDEGELPIRVTLYPMLDEIEQAATDAKAWTRDAVRLGGAKIFTDGTLNSRTAWTLEPFAEPIPDHPRGTPIMTPDEIEAAVRRVDALALPLAAHAIGDGAVRAVLDAIERVRPSTPGYRIEHCELIDEADVPRFARLAVVASVQPCHLLADIEALRRFLPHRLDRVLPLRELIDSGCEPGGLLWFGSDVPIVRADPEDSIVAATLRRRPGMPEAELIAPFQAISEDEAWKAFAPG